MVQQLGDVPASATVRFGWSTNAADGSSITRGTNGSIRIYKNSSDTQRSSSNGITDTEDFDSLTGIHDCVIDTSDNTDAGFYAAGNDYRVVLQGAVIDGKTVNVWLAHFSIDNRNPKVNVTKVNGTNQTAGDLAALINTIDDFLDTEIAAILAAVDTEVAAILADTNELQTDWVDGGRLDLIIDAINAKTTNLPASPAAVGSAMTLTAGERNAVADAKFDRTNAIETGLTERQAFRLALSVLAGLLSGAGTATNVFRNAVADSKDRVTATVDAAGNRTAITLDLT